MLPGKEKAKRKKGKYLTRRKVLLM